MTAAFGLLLLAACGDSGTGEPRDLCNDPPTSCFDPNFEGEVLRTKLEGCAGDPAAGGCHSKGSLQHSMELDLRDSTTTVDAAMSALVGEFGISGDPLIDVDCVGDSYMLRKLTGDGILGSRMPLTSDEWWTNDEVECFRAYLTRNFMQAEME